MSGPLSRKDAIRAGLERTLGLVQFTDIQAHLARDAVFIVGPTVSLLECGVSVALDDVDVVRAWIEDGSLRKPTMDERSTWPKAAGKRWTSVVVVPFVLVQDPPD